MSKLGLFPWDNGSKPDFINEEGFEWYTDKTLTGWAQRKDELNNTPPLKAVCFYVKKDDTLTRILVGANQEVLHEDTSLDGMACKIDILRLANSYDKEEEEK